MKPPYPLKQCISGSGLLTMAVTIVLATHQGRAEVVPLDLSDGFNHDAYITWEEATHAALYNPPANWAIGSRLVPTVFGQHAVSTSSSRVLCWADQGPDGLPANGALSTSYGTFQLSTERDAEPVGGFVLGAQGAPPSLPLASNVLRVSRPHSGSTGYPTASASVDLPGNQQAKYDSVNFLVSGNNGKALIYANYDDGGGGIDQQLIYQSPGTPKTAGETGFADIINTSSTNPDIVSADTMTHLWSQSSNYSDVRSGTANIWTFANPIALDPSKTLVGFTLAIYDADTWKARQAIIYAAAANTTRPAIYVDAVNGSNTTGNGSSANPYQTIAHVVPLLVGGEDVILRNGSYGNVTINKSGNLFPDWVVIKAAPGATPELGRFILAGPSGLQDQTGGYDAYVRLENLILRDGWKADGARHWALSGCLIERIGPWTGNATNMAKTAVEFRNGTDITIEGCEITNTAVGVSGRGHEIALRGCHIHHGSHDAVQVTGWWNSIVEDNVIHAFDDGVTDAEASWSKHCDLIHIFIPGPAPDGWENNNVMFRYNVLYDAEAQGVQFNNYLGRPVLHNKNITFEYNVFGPSQANLFNNAEPTDGLVFRHNTVAYVPGGRTLGRWTLANHSVRIGASTGVQVYNNNVNTISFDAGSQVDLFDWNILRTAPNPSPTGVDDKRALGRFTQVGVDYLLADPEDFDGALQPTSPAINGGTLAYAPTPLPGEDLAGTPLDIRPDIGAWEMPGQSPTAEPQPNIINDTKTAFVDDFEDGHYNDVDPWVNAVATQGLSWYRPASSTFKFFVQMSADQTRNALICPSGVTGQQRIAWLLSEQGDDWAGYDLTFRAFNRYLTHGTGPVVLALDENTCYWIDIGRDSGRIVRIMGGTSTVLATNAAIELPHLGAVIYKIGVRQVAGGIQITVDAGNNGSIELSFTDTNPTAVATFGAGGIGVHDDNNVVNNKASYDDFRVDVVDFAP